MKKKIRIGIAGYGFVGKAHFDFFHKHFETIVYDPFYKAGESENYIYADAECLIKCDMVVICIPTPYIPGEGCQLVDIENLLNRLNDSLVVIKSTIPPGTTRSFQEKFKKLRLVFSPEYIGETGFYVPDEYAFRDSVVKTPWYIFGGNTRDCSEVIRHYSVIAGPFKKYLTVESEEAEMAKYMTNSFLAAKTVFCNEVYEICRSSDISYDRVRELWLQDPRINPSHTSVFEENHACFGGKCLPKDLASIIDHSLLNGYNPEFFSEIKKSNQRIANCRQSRLELESENAKSKAEV